MKQPLLLLHGALGSASQFDAIINGLSASFEVHTLDFSGHGGRAAHEAFSMQLFANNVIDYLQEHSIASIDIFGYSMGGYVALQLANMVPEKVKSIVTLGTKFAWDSASAEKEVQLLNPEVIETKVPAFAKQLQRLHAPQDWKEVMHQTAQMMLALGAGACLKDTQFNSIPHKVVLGIGSLDRMVSYEETLEVSTLLPNATLITLEGVPHPIDKVDPLVLLDYIKTHVNSDDS